MNVSGFHNSRVITVGVWITFVLLTGCVGKGGTTIMLRTNELLPSPHPVSGRVAILNEADDSYPHSPTIGKATWTLFRGYLAPIKADPSPKTQIIALTKSSFARAGYQISLVQAHEAASDPSPMVHVKINEFSYEMWSWLWPYVPIWGSTALTVTVRTQDGREIESRGFQAEGRESCWFGECAKQVEAAVAQSLTSIMSQLTGWASEESFRSAVAPSQLQQRARP